MTNKIYYIREFAAEVGVHANTVRKYQKRGFIKERRNPFGYRVFTEKDITAVRNVILREKKKPRKKTKTKRK